MEFKACTVSYRPSLFCWDSWPMRQATATLPPAFHQASLMKCWYPVPLSWMKRGTVKMKYFAEEHKDLVRSGT